MRQDHLVRRQVGEPRHLLEVGPVVAHLDLDDVVALRWHRDVDAQGSLPAGPADLGAQRRLAQHHEQRAGAEHDVVDGRPDAFGLLDERVQVGAQGEGRAGVGDLDDQGPGTHRQQPHVHADAQRREGTDLDTGGLEG